MKVGDLVRHHDGSCGIVTDVDVTSDYPYMVLFHCHSPLSQDSPSFDWFIKDVFEVISESR